MIIRCLKEICYCIYKIIVISVFNYKNDIYIYSVHASLKAVYGGQNIIERGTFIASNVKMGYKTYVNRDSWLENCEIGNYCSISSRVMICPSEHYLERPLSHPIFGCKKTKKVIIGHDVLISHGATILSGVNIGNGAVIAAGAVVTKDVEPYTVVGGIPATVIKQRFSEGMIKKIVNEKLYYKTEEEVKKFWKENNYRGVS